MQRLLTSLILVWGLIGCTSSEALPTEQAANLCVYDTLGQPTRDITITHVLIDDFGNTLDGDVPAEFIQRSPDGCYHIGIVGGPSNAAPDTLRFVFYVGHQGRVIQVPMTEAALSDGKVVEVRFDH